MLKPVKSVFRMVLTYGLDLGVRSQSQFQDSRLADMTNDLQDETVEHS